MRRIVIQLFIASATVAIFPGCITQPMAVQQVNPKLGQEFKIKDISGTEVTVSIVEKAGRHYIRSPYHHGWTTEVRDYAVTNAIRFVSVSDRAINIWFPLSPDAKVAGAVYVINTHGEPVKVDEITIVDLTW